MVHIKVVRDDSISLDVPGWNYLGTKVVVCMKTIDEGGKPTLVFLNDAFTSKLSFSGEFKSKLVSGLPNGSICGFEMGCWSSGCCFMLRPMARTSVLCSSGRNKHPKYPSRTSKQSEKLGFDVKLVSAKWLLRKQGYWAGDNYWETTLNNLTKVLNYTYHSNFERSHDRYKEWHKETATKFF